MNHRAAVCARMLAGGGAPAQRRCSLRPSVRAPKATRAWPASATCWKRLRPDAAPGRASECMGWAIAVQATRRRPRPTRLPANPMPRSSPKTGYFRATRLSTRSAPIPPNWLRRPLPVRAAEPVLEKMRLIHPAQPAPHPGGTHRRFRPNPSREGTIRHRLLAYVEPRRRRYRILHNQRGPLLATTVRARTDATIPIRLH
jgi:hypothetical protein